MSPSRRCLLGETDRGTVGRPDAPLSGPGAALLVGLALVAGACAPKPGTPSDVEPPPDPFERAPYVQAVQDDRAVVIWRMTNAEATSELRYRVEGGPWRRAEARRVADRDRDVALEGLPPSSQVEFSVTGDGREIGPFRFRTAPPDTSGAAVDVLAFGDSGWGSEAQTDLARLMRDRPWDLALHVGDLAYPDGSEEDFTLRHFQVYGPLLARTPLFPSPGNHDVRPAGGHGEPYDRAFRWPGADADRRSYSFRWGRTRFVSLDTSTDTAVAELSDRDGRQFRWLEEVLASSARDRTIAWTVVFTHVPFYSRAAGFSGHGPEEGLRRALEPLFLEHGVDLVLTGHDHHYERSRPVRDGAVVPPGCGPVYFVTGGGGATRFARSVTPGDPAARVSRDHHFLALTLTRDGGSGEAVGRDGEVLDRFRLEPYEPDGSACPD
ncbi:MAG: metallophosphoesterase [Gemmatimonadota bacterium]